MPRVARIVVPGLPHHITQRDNNRQVVFHTDEQRELYLELLKKHAGYTACRSGPTA
jgi:putative transposase